MERRRGRTCSNWGWGSQDRVLLVILIPAEGDKLDLLRKRGLRLLDLSWLWLTKVLLLTAAAANAKLLLSSLELLPLEKLLLWLCCWLLGAKGLLRGDLRLWLLAKLLLWLLLAKQ